METIFLVESKDRAVRKEAYEGLYKVYEQVPTYPYAKTQTNESSQLQCQSSQNSHLPGRS